MWRSILLRLSTTLVLCVASVSAFASPPPARLVDRIISTYGGEAAWSKVAAIRQTGKVFSAMQGEGALVREWVKPDKLRITLDYASKRETRVVNGLSGWRDGTPVNGTQLDAMILQAARIGLPSLLIGHRQNLRDLGARERGGKTFDVIEIPLTTYMSIEIEVDRETGRIVRSIGRAFMPGSSGRIEFVAVYDDYRKVDGLLFAFHEENFASGFKTAMTKLDMVEVVRSRSGVPQP